MSSHTYQMQRRRRRPVHGEYGAMGAMPRRRVKREDKTDISRHAGTWSPATARSYLHSPQQSPPPEPSLSDSIQTTPPRIVDDDDMENTFHSPPPPPPPPPPSASPCLSTAELQPPPSVAPTSYQPIERDHWSASVDMKPTRAHASVNARFHDPSPLSEARWGGEIETNRESDDTGAGSSESSSDAEIKDRRPKKFRPDLTKSKKIPACAQGGRLQREVERILRSDSDITEYNQNGFPFQCIPCNHSLFAKDLRNHVHTTKHQNLKTRRILDTARVRRGEEKEKKRPMRRNVKLQNSGTIEYSGLYDGTMSIDEPPLVQAERVDSLSVNKIVKRGGVYDCELCGITIASHDQTFALLEAKAHADTEDHKIRKQAAEDSMPPPPKKVHEIPTEAQIELLKASMIKQLSGPKFKCRCCDAVLLGKTTVLAHVESGYHRSRYYSKATASGQTETLEFEMKKFWSSVNSTVSVQARLDSMIKNARHVLEHDPRSRPELDEFLTRILLVRKSCHNTKSPGPIPFMR